MNELESPLKRKPLSPHEQRVKDLFFQSFRFSQGDTSTQRPMFDWFGLKGYLDDLPIPDSPPQYILDIVAPRKHSAETGNINDLQRPRTISKMWSALGYAQEKRAYVPEKLLEEILLGMIRRDTVYQLRERPGRQSTGAVMTDSINDPHASYIRKYILNQSPTGSEEFDDLHRELAPILGKYLDMMDENFTPSAETPIQNSLSLLRDLWEAKHREQSFNPQTTILQ